jgi:hypothetical protein
MGAQETADTVDVRKRIFFGMAVLAGAGAGAYLVREFREPQLRTVEYHKREYLKDVGRADRSIVQFVSSCVAEHLTQEHATRAKFHRDALLKLGYFEQRAIVLSNCSVWEAAEALQSRLTNVNLSLTDFRAVGADIINVVGPREEAAVWEKVIREVDVRPESGKRQ